MIILMAGETAKDISHGKLTVEWMNKYSSLSGVKECIGIYKFLLYLD